MQVIPIKRKILTMRRSGLKTTTIATNPAAQKYSFSQTARWIKTMAPRQITTSTRGSYRAAKYENMEAIANTGIEPHLVIFVSIWNIVVLFALILFQCFRPCVGLLFGFRFGESISLLNLAHQVILLAGQGLNVVVG